MNALPIARIVSAAVVVAACGGFGPVAMGDQPGQAAMPSPSARVGGPRMALPTPRINSGRSGTLLNRGGSLLPPSPARARADAGGSMGSRSGFPSRGMDNGPRRPFAAGDPMGGAGGVERGLFYDNGGVTASGVSVDGTTQSDHFKLRFHIGSDCNRVDQHGGRGHFDGHHDGHHGVDCFPNVWYPTWWSGWWWYNSYPSYPQYVYSGPWYGTDPFVTDGTATTYPATTDAPAGGTQADQAAREPSPIELADAAWQAGRLTEAVRYMKEYLATAPDDADAMRFLALLKIDQGKLDEAVALMAMAYERMPRLASRPLPASDIPGGTAQMRQRVNTMSGYANRAKTGSAWLTLAVLVQGEGRDSVARTLVGRAERAGLKPTLVSELNDALSR